MAIDYKNVLGKWRFMIGGRDPKGRVFPANPELDNSRDLDSVLCFFSLIGLVQAPVRTILEWPKRMKPKEVKIGAGGGVGGEKDTFLKMTVSGDAL